MADALPENGNATFVSNNDANKRYKFNKKYLRNLSILLGWKLNIKMAALSKLDFWGKNLKSI